MLSSQGERDSNEDSIGFEITDNITGFFLADGLGSHIGGGMAADFAVKIAKRIIKKANYTSSEQYIHKIFEGIHLGLIHWQEEFGMPSAFKTTFVMLLINNGRAIWAHIGDSRLYRFTRDSLIYITKDHSVSQMLVTRGEITSSQVRSHCDRYRLVKFLGVEGDEKKYEISDQIIISPGDSFLLCSDGFWEWIEEQRIINCLRDARCPQEWLIKMKNEVIINGTGKNMDNYSAICITVI